RCYRYRRRAQGADDAVLASHVVGAREHVPEGRAAQHVPLAPIVGDPVGEIGMPAGDEIEAEGGRGPVDVVGEPRAPRYDVDAVGLSHDGEGYPGDGR